MKMEKSKLVSFVVFAYNQELYIEDAVKAALAQDYENLEIIISDDHSSDKTYEIINRIISNYKGPHKIIINRNEKKLGIREHINFILYNLVHGDYILIAGGDDISLPNRTSVYVDYFETFPSVMSISCKSEEVDSNLNPITWGNNIFDNTYSIYNINDYIENQFFFLYSGDSRAFRHSVIEQFPPLEFPASEDIFLFLRSLLLGSGCYIRTPLVKRRHHNNNYSSKKNTNDGLKRSLKQLKKDIELAYENGFINNEQKNLLLRKVLFFLRFEKIYGNPPFSSPKCLYFRILRKFFKLILCC